MNHNRNEVVRIPLIYLVNAKFYLIQKQFHELFANNTKHQI